MSGFYIGVDGKARKVKGGYIGIDGVARKIKKGYIGDANGVARLCYQSTVEWAKYSSAKEFGDFTKLTAKSETKRISDGTVYPSYEFSAKSGYEGTGASSTLSSLGSNAVNNYYRIETEEFDAYKQTKVYLIYYWYPAGDYYQMSIEAIAQSDVIGYQKGDVSYGVVTTEYGKIPENGTLVEGSVDGDHCIVDVNGTYYYYEKV